MLVVGCWHTHWCVIFYWLWRQISEFFPIVLFLDFCGSFLLDFHSSFVFFLKKSGAHSKIKIFEDYNTCTKAKQDIKWNWRFLGRNTTPRWSCTNDICFVMRNFIFFLHFLLVMIYPGINFLLVKDYVKQTSSSKNKEILAKENGKVHVSNFNLPDG